MLEKFKYNSLMENFRDPLVQKIAGFLNAIGIETVPARPGEGCFLPGIRVENGRLLVDEEHLAYPGDLLHEAGHLALAPAGVRAGLSGEVVIPGADMDAMEILATAWAFAATVHLELAPDVLFHTGGYRGKSESLIFTYGLGVYPGANGLEKFGLTATGAAARRLNAKPYPHMLKWLRES